MPNKLPTLGRPERAKPKPDYRPAPSKRGYGRTWQRVRLAHLAEFPLCADCQAEGLIAEATEVDHRDGDTGNLSPENLRSLCKPHHSRKTCRENGGLGFAKRGAA